MRQWIDCSAAIAALSMVVSAHAGDSAGTTATDAQQQVLAAERAFAQTMADRDHAAFTRFVSEEAVFFSGTTPLRGRSQVAQAWARFYQAQKPPFSWEPGEVEVLPSGTLALSSGPVHDPAGRLIGRFTSIWRLEPPGEWRVIFDKGSPACNGPAP